MFFIRGIVLLFVVYSVQSEDACLTFSFENGFQDSFNADTGVCTTIQQSWEEGLYADIGVTPPNALSSTYISPLASITSLSCSSSFNFLMTAGGVVEVTVYMSGDSNTDYLTVMVIQSSNDGNDAVVGNLDLTPAITGFVPGWNTQRITLLSSGSFQGYVSFIGMVSENSTLLVDSFRYIPPSIDEDSCVVYDVLSTSTSATDETTATTPEVDITETTEATTLESESTQEPEEITPTTVEYEVTNSTTASPEDITGTTQDDGTTEASIESCTTYNFETDYDTHFFNDNYLCEGFLPWQLDNYTSIDIESPNTQSTVFITPHETMSCMNSFVFKMDPDGIVEATVYMDPVQALDHIIILAHRVTGREYDTTAGFKMYHPENGAFVVGWNVIRFSLLELTSFDGYLIFLGAAYPGSTVLVDSIRYIPPQTPSEDPSCDLY